MIQFLDLKELSYLKDFNRILDTFEKLGQVICELGCGANAPSIMQLNNGALEFDMSISIPLESSIMRKSKPPNKFLDAFREAIEKRGTQ